MLTLIERLLAGTSKFLRYLLYDWCKAYNCVSPSIMVSESTFPVPENQQIIHILSHLTAVCGMNAWTCTGSCRWKMYRTNPISGAGNIIMRGRIHPWITWLRLNSSKVSETFPEVEKEKSCKHTDGLLRVWKLFCAVNLESLLPVGNFPDALKVQYYITEWYICFIFLAQQ